MKYIRGQNGWVYSVSQIRVPQRATVEGEVIWRLKLITVDGLRNIYATFGTEAAALKAHKAVLEFLGMPTSGLLLFGIGIDGMPPDRLMEQTVPNTISSTDDAQEEPDDTTGDAD